MKPGIVITTHHNNGVLCLQCLECFLRHVPNSFIVLYVNESSDPKILNIKNNYPNVKYIYIEDQTKNGGLTATWNDGVKLCLENNCEIIILSNDDIFFDASIKYIIEQASKCNKEEMKYFGPLTNNPGPTKINKAVQYGTHSINKSSYKCEYNNKYVNINGFFMVFPKHVLENNMYDKTNFFNPNLPFEGNETEWFNRFKKNNGIPIIVPKTFIYHYKLGIWRNKQQNDTCIYTINFGNYEGKKLYLKNNTDIDNIYFTDNPSMKENSIIHKCIRNKIIFLYINTQNYTSDNWWSAQKLAQRIIKTCPHNYLPLNYTKSLYLDGDRKLTKKMYKRDIYKLLKTNDIICYDNPWPRGNPPTVRAERKTILKQKLEKKENLDKIWNIITTNNFPDTIGLSETSILIRNHNNIKKFSNEWAELIKICIRDQMSFEYLLWKHKINFKRYNLKYRDTEKKGHHKTHGRRIK